MSTASFQATRTIGVAVPPTAACNWLSTIGGSFGTCSVSISIQSNPEPAMISTETLLQRLLQSPICGLPARISRLNSFSGISLVKTVIYVSFSVSIDTEPQNGCGV